MSNLGGTATWHISGSPGGGLQLCPSVIAVRDHALVIACVPPDRRVPWLRSAHGACHGHYLCVQQQNKHTSSRQCNKSIKSTKPSLSRRRTGRSSALPERPKLPGVRWTACMRELSCSLCSCGTLDFAECRSGLESASQKTKYYCTSETKDYMSEASDDEKTSRLDRCPHQVDGLLTLL